jgi:hypothetical protein
MRVIAWQLSLSAATLLAKSGNHRLPRSSATARLYSCMMLLDLASQEGVIYSQNMAKSSHLLDIQYVSIHSKTKVAKSCQVIGAAHFVGCSTYWILASDLADE